jgi:hypothetical protein
LGLQFCNVLSLGAFLALDNFELDVITLLQALVALRLDGAVVDEHIGTIVSADEAESLCVVKPFDFTFISSHVPYSTDFSTRSRCALYALLVDLDSLGLAT